MTGPNGPEAEITDPSRDQPTITAYPDGPLIVRGDVTILSADGEPITRTRRTVALCRCGVSSIKPFCDGSHKVIGFCTDGSDRASRVSGAAEARTSPRRAGGPTRWNREDMSEPAQTPPSEQPYDPSEDPDADPGQLQPIADRPSQAEGEDASSARPPSEG